MIQFLEGEATYTPKEATLTVAGLKEVLADLHAQMTTVNNARKVLRNARGYRSK